MTANTINTYEQVYNIQEDENLLTGLAHVVCVLAQRGLMVAGFSNARELLSIHYTGYNTNKPIWGLDFFEHLFANEPLLAAREKIRGVFICNDKNLVVPNDLYDESEAKNWLKQIYFTELQDVTDTYPLEADNAMYLLAAPLSITELIKINFKKAAILPLVIYQFNNTDKQSLYLQCCITNEVVCATLHNYSQLLWHKVFDYSCAEDIAYEINLFCAENHIATGQISLNCNMISAGEYNTVNELSQYFPGLRSGDGRAISSSWDGAICLAQQLLSCV